jgi:hypothetical protein
MRTPEIEIRQDFGITIGRRTVRGRVAVGLWPMAAMLVLEIRRMICGEWAERFKLGNAVDGCTPISTGRRASHNALPPHPRSADRELAGRLILRSLGGGLPCGFGAAIPEPRRLLVKQTRKVV